MLVLIKVPLKTKEWDRVSDSYNTGLAMTFGQTLPRIGASGEIQMKASSQTYCFC